MLPELPDWPLSLCAERFSEAYHGDYPRWQAAVDALPSMAPCRLNDAPTVHIDGTPSAGGLEDALKALHPWRKGPFRFADVHIDTEWRSDWKWQRIAPGLGSLTGHRVLDIGCGNGYFGWRMLAAGAREVVGVDPTLLFCMQHRAVQRYVDHPRHWVLPLRGEELPQTAGFDSVFSLGVVYHRRDPEAHVRHLRALTRPGGQGVLESLVVPDPVGLTPADRYARMRNVWRVPAISELMAWMRDAGFTDVRLLDVSPTTVAEQRRTEWMHFESLARALDPDDPTRTVEDHPAPLRAAVLGRVADGVR